MPLKYFLVEYCFVLCVSDFSKIILYWIKCNHLRKSTSRRATRNINIRRRTSFAPPASCVIICFWMVNAICSMKRMILKSQINFIKWKPKRRQSFISRKVIKIMRIWFLNASRIPCCRSKLLLRRRRKSKMKIKKKKKDSSWERKWSPRKGHIFKQSMWVSTKMIRRSYSGYPKRYAIGDRSIRK